MIVTIGLVVVALIVLGVVHHINEKHFHEVQSEILKALNIKDWHLVDKIDTSVTVKSRKTLENYDEIKFFKENQDELAKAENIIKRKKEIGDMLKSFLQDNEYKDRPQYDRVHRIIDEIIRDSKFYRIKVSYISSAGNNLGEKIIEQDVVDLERFRKDPSLLMTKGEYNKYLKEKQKEALTQKHKEYYDSVNKIIDYANNIKSHLVIKESDEQLDLLIGKLFDRTVNSIKKIKTIDSEEWDIIRNLILQIRDDVKEIAENNQRILDYYNSDDFNKIKETCETLMSTQREFNEYISEKAQAISTLFGTRVTRNETVNSDEYEYIRPYKKTITPFTAEVSATVFASAENNPLDYVVKNFYPNKTEYPQQIKKLHLLIEELETLKEAKQIIENYKAEYKQYLGDVPAYVLEQDESGFYSRLGFANIDESVLIVAYKFVYTSGGGMAQRSFTVPMTEETIIDLIKKLESKLTFAAFAKEQRALMTKKLREFIKKRDNFTCCNCGNSIKNEPNLLLEIDHKIPVSKGGLTEEENLQTLCWKCNRAKGSKLL